MAGGGDRRAELDDSGETGIVAATHVTQRGHAARYLRTALAVMARGPVSGLDLMPTPVCRRFPAFVCGVGR